MTAAQREIALDQAVGLARNAASCNRPKTVEEIVEAAEAFLAFLDPPARTTDTAAARSVTFAPGEIDAITSALRKKIRELGGDVQAVFGTTR